MYYALMNRLFHLQISARPILRLFGKSAGVKPQLRVGEDERQLPRMLDDWELLCRLQSIRAALGPKVADEATRRAAVAMARTVQEFAEHRAKSATRRSHTAANLPNDAVAAGERTTVEEGCLDTFSRHEEIP
jgi:hypothetical protein